MRVAILGASGFVGGALARRLTDAGVEVIGLGRPSFDLLDRATWTSLLAADCLVHAAGGHIRTTWDAFAVNLLPCEALAGLCNALGIPRLVYLSTGRVYGYGPQAAYPGMDCKPVGDYPVSKYLAERVLAGTFAGTTSIARLYYPYGAGQEPPRVFPRLALQVARGETVTCAADGGPRLSVAHVDDLAEVLARDFVLAGQPPALANLASDTVLSIEQVVHKLGVHLGIEPRLLRQGPALDEFSQPYAGPFHWRPFDVADILPAALR